MELAAFVLFAAFVIVAIVASIVYRDYRRLYVQTHHDDAPFFTYMFERDRDPAVEVARVRTNWLSLLLLVVVILLVAVVTPGRQPAP